MALSYFILFPQISLQLIVGSRWRKDNDKFKCYVINPVTVSRQRFNVRLKFRSRTIHFDSLIAKGKSNEGVSKLDTKAFNFESNFHL